MVATTAGIAVERGTRIAAIDVARGVALGAMIVYHFAFDLQLRGLIAADVAADFGWVLLARATAGTFLFLVGVNLVLATRRGIRLWHFLRRLALIAGGAALVSLTTWLLEVQFGFDRGTFIFFGILHAIAVASVLAIPFVQAPPYVTAITAAVVLAAPYFIASSAFSDPFLLWVGLSPRPPATIDYVPIFPWLGVVLAGVVSGRLFADQGADRTLAQWRPKTPVLHWIAVTGQWSLAIYLVHQPILVGALSVAAPFLTPRTTPEPVLAEGVIEIRETFMGTCEPACRGADRDAPTCTAFCGCMFESLYGTDLFSAPSVELMTAEQQQRWTATVNRCAAPVPPAQ